MVFCGKPSGGCHSCRQKKTRCDQRPDGCTQCERAKRECPGYRVPGDIIFRNESENVIRKFKAKEARTKESASTPPTLITSPPAEALDSGSEASLEIVRQWPSPISSHSLSPSFEDRATLFFVSNYVVAERGPTRGHLDYLANLYYGNCLDEGVIASMKAVGFAGFAHAVHAPSLMKNARYQYIKALQLTNAALRSPVDVKKDTTLMTIMILGIYETVTGIGQRSLTAWAEHVAGASALIKLRGREQLKTAGGRRMFMQVVSTLMISCIQRGLPLPDYIVEWTAEARKFLSTPDPAWIVQETVMAFTNFNASVVSGSCSDPEIILARALELDGRYLSLFINVPSGWEYQTIITDAHADVVYDGRYHIYFDYWIAQMWNSMRTIRIMLHQHIRDALLKGFSAKPPLFSMPEHTAQFQISTDTLYKMQADILASVPQHLGVGARTPHPLPNTSGAQSNDLAVVSFPWSYFKETNNEDFPVVRASAPYFLMWPLWFAGVIDVATEPAKQYVIKILKIMGHTMGIQQAIFLANVIETKSGIKFSAKG